MSLKAPTNFMWTRVGICSILERYRHAGISSDGKICFVTEFDDERYAAWDVDTEEVIWGPVENDNESVPTQLLKDSKLTVEEGPAKGSYRIIGLGDNYPLLEHSGLRLELDKKSQHLVLISKETGAELQRMLYADFSGDWAFTTFSDDGSSIIVLTPYDVTVFRQGQSIVADEPLLSEPTTGQLANILAPSNMTNVLRIEDAESMKPKKLQGDIYCTPDQIAFVAFKRGSLSPLFVVFFNIFWFLIRAQKMEAWRDSLRGKSIDQMVQENEDSWVLQRTHIREMKRSFPATLTVTTVAGPQYKVQVPRFTDFKEFAVRNHYPIG